jgi:hypothetical protein
MDYDLNIILYLNTQYIYDKLQLEPRHHSKQTMPSVMTLTHKEHGHVLMIFIVMSVLMVMNVISESLVITAINKLKWIHCPQQRA